MSFEYRKYKALFLTTLDKSNWFRPMLFSDLPESRNIYKCFSLDNNADGKLTISVLRSTVLPFKLYIDGLCKELNCTYKHEKDSTILHNLELVPCEKFTFPFSRRDFIQLSKLHGFL